MPNPQVLFIYLFFPSILSEHSCSDIYLDNDIFFFGGCCMRLYTCIVQIRGKWVDAHPGIHNKN